MKEHIVQLAITNNTDVPLRYHGNKMESGKINEDYTWPATIAPWSTVSITCTERDWTIGPTVGCSGWVAYTLNGRPLYFAFSNPSLISENGIELGTSESAWDTMHGQYTAVSRALPLAGSHWVTATIKSTDGPVNNASWDIRTCDVATIQAANLELQNVEQVHARFPTTGLRRYYKTTSAPTFIPGLAMSHFKGIAYFAGKLIFTHTNLDFGAMNGKYLIADNQVRSGQGATTATFDTPHNDWLHPCSSQACGSFMAMGMQADESGPGAAASEIQLLDIRPTQLNQPARLLGSIERPHDGVNGVGITKEAGPDGRYIVAGVNGGNLTLYRSRSASLLTNGAPTVGFDELFHTTTFPDSGAGLALVTQQGDGAIFLFALNADEGTPSFLNLYRLHLDTTPVSYKLVAKKEMQVPGISESVTKLTRFADVLPFGDRLAHFGEAMLNSSFRWGKGLAVTSPTTIEVYASDRNTMPYSDLPPLVKSDKDFSLVVWSNSGPAEPVYLTGNDGLYTLDVPTGELRPVAGTAGYGFSGIVAVGRTLYLTAQGPDGIWAFDVATGRLRQLAFTAGQSFIGIAAAGSVLYLTKRGSSGVWRLDPTTSSLQPLPGTAGAGFRGVTAVGNRLYLTTQGGDGIWWYDLAASSLHRFDSTVGCGFSGVVAVGNTLYLTTQGSDGIWTFDLAWQRVRPLVSTKGCGFSGIMAHGPVLYLTAQGPDGIWEYDAVTDTLRPLPSTGKATFRGIAPVQK